MREKDTILIIDDEPIVGDALKTILVDRGYQVTVVRTGGEGLDQIRKQRFDFAITDFRLPDMNGLQVMSGIREMDTGIPLIMITAYRTPEIVTESKRLGALEVLAKPFFPADILRLLYQSSKKQSQ
jgi:CheY-like chemotaxis protein